MGLALPLCFSQAKLVCRGGPQKADLKATTAHSFPLASILEKLAEKLFFCVNKHVF